MAKKRVHEIARERGMSSKEVIATLQKAGLDVKAAASSVDENDVARAFNGGGAAPAPQPQPQPRRPPPPHRQRRPARTPRAPGSSPRPGGGGPRRARARRPRPSRRSASRAMGR